MTEKRKVVVYREKDFAEAIHKDEELTPKQSVNITRTDYDEESGYLRVEYTIVDNPHNEVKK